MQTGISPVYTNAGDAKIKGAELELTSLLGHGFQLNLSGSYIDAYYTSVVATANFPQTALPDGTTVCPAGPPICGAAGYGNSPLDAKLPKTPKFKGTIAPQWDFGLQNNAIIRTVAAFTYISEMFNDSLNTPQLRRPASRNRTPRSTTWRPNVRLCRGRQTRPMTGLSPQARPTTAPVRLAATNPPRMWYVSLRVNMKP